MGEMADYYTDYGSMGADAYGDYYNQPSLKENDMPDKIKTPEFRGSYVNLVTPRKANEDADPTYQMVIVLPKEDKATKAFLKKLNDQIDAVVLEKTGKKVPHKRLKHFPIKDGDSDWDDDQFAGCWTISVSNKKRPGCIDKKQEVLADEEELYSGAWYRVTVTAWCWSNKFGTGASINLHTVLKTRDDEPLGGGGNGNAEADFADELEGGDADEEDDDDYEV